MRMLGVERPGAELFYSVPIDHGGEILVVQHLNFGDLVRGPEAIEEVHEGNFGFQSGEVRNGSHIHNFLHGVAADHGKASLPGGHDVCMIAENAQRMRSQGSCGDMEHAGQQLTGNFVHVGNHEQKTLRRRERRSESASGQGTVHSTRCARLALQLAHLHFLPEDVQPSLGSPLIAGFRHRGRRRDGVDGADIGKRICDMRGRCIAING